MKNRRNRILIEPRFQIQLLLRLGLWVCIATLFTAAILFLSLWLTDRGQPGGFFFIAPGAEAHPVWLSRTRIIIPTLTAALLFNLALTLLFALRYSQRLAGPIHRLAQAMLRLARGEGVPEGFQLREADEFQEVAHAFDALLKRLSQQRDGPA